MKRIFAIFSVLAVLAVAITVGGPMAFGKTLILCSAIEGRLVDGAGAPVSGVQVTRNWNDSYSGKTGQDRTATDGEGRFAFGEVTNKSMMAGIVPHTPSITCTIEAQLDGGSQILLDLDKGNYERNGEIRDEARRARGISVTCKAGAKASADGWYWGTCTLDD